MGEAQGEKHRSNTTVAFSSQLLRGLVQPSDMPDSRTTTSKICYNVSRCTGLEVKKALLLFCKRSIYFVDGFELIEGDGLEGTIERVAEEESKFDVQLRRASSVDMGKPGEGDGGIQPNKRPSRR